MLIKHLLENENGENYKNIISRIAESKYFNEMYGTQLQTIEPEDLENPDLVRKFDNMYRGSDNYKAPYLVIAPYEERRPSDTNIEIHNYVNMISKEKYGVPVRNLIFADKRITLAEEYGEPYVLFPLGDYRLFYHKGVRDFTEYYSTYASIAYEIISEVIARNPNKYDEFVLEAVLETFEHYELDYENRKKFDKSLKKMARKMAAEYFIGAEKDKVKPSDVKILEKLFYTYGRELFKKFEKYASGIKVTKSIHDIYNEEIMVQADEIAAVHTESFNSMLSQILEIKKGS
jgi:hypothetical protein